MKKVLFVATVVKTHIMTFHLPYLRWFKENGYETHVCARNDYEDKRDCLIPFCDKYYDVPFERSPFRPSNLKAYSMLKKIIEENDYELIHCHTPVGAALTRLAARNARRKGTRVIYTAHGFHFYEGAPFLSWLLYYPAERFLARYTDLLITINKEDYSRAQKFPAQKVVYVPGVGIDTRKFRIATFNREKKRRELGIPEGSFVLLSVGELSKGKNHETTIRAFAKLSLDNAMYLICGQGPLENYLRNLVVQLGVEKKVKFLGFRTDIPEICLASDVFLFPSYQEGLPVALMEAMAAGLPVICSSIRGNIDLVTDGKNGYLVAPSDIDGFAACIAKVLSNAELRAVMGQNNMRRIQFFDIANVMGVMSELYRTEEKLVSE